MNKERNQAKYMQTHHWIAYYRKQAGLTQEDVVARLAKYDIYIDRSAISHWESGTEPSFNVLLALANIFGVKVDDFRPRYYLEDAHAAEDKNTDGGDFVEKLKKWTKKITSERLEEVLNNVLKEHNYLKNGGLYEVSVDDIYRKIGLSEAFFYDINIHSLVTVATEFKKRGYSIQQGEIGNISTSFFYVAIAGGEKASTQFELDYSEILNGLIIGLREKDGINRANDTFGAYKREVESLMDAIFYPKGAKMYKGEYIFHYGEDKNNLYEMDEIFSAPGKEELLKLLETVKPSIFWIDGLCGGVSWEYYDKFKTAFSKNSLPKFHIYCLRDEAGEYVECGEEFAYTDGELFEIVNNLKCEFFELEEKVYKTSEAKALCDKLLKEKRNEL